MLGDGLRRRTPGPLGQLDHNARPVDERESPVVEVQDVAPRRDPVRGQVRQHRVQVGHPEAHVAEPDARQRAGTFVGPRRRPVEPQQLDLLVRGAPSSTKVTWSASQSAMPM